VTVCRAFQSQQAQSGADYGAVDAMAPTRGYCGFQGISGSHSTIAAYSDNGLPFCVSNGKGQGVRNRHDAFE
jgi:hypothetical protein